MMVSCWWVPNGRSQRSRRSVAPGDHLLCPPGLRVGTASWRAAAPTRRSDRRGLFDRSCLRGVGEFVVLEPASSFGSH